MGIAQKVLAHDKALAAYFAAKGKGYETFVERQKGGWYRVTGVKPGKHGYTIVRYSCFDGPPLERCAHHTAHVTDAELAVIDRIREG